MKIIALIFLSALWAHADMVITEKVEGEGRSMTMTLELKGDKVRMDPSPQMCTITDTATGEVTTIMNAQKTFMKVSRAAMDQLRSPGARASPAPSSTPAPKLIDTGKSEKIGAFNTEIYTLDSPNAKFTFWASKDIPHYAATADLLRKYRAMKRVAGPSIAAPDTTGMQGVPVKTEILSHGQTLSITILCAQEKPVPDSEMAPPPGYSEVSMP